MRCLEQYLIIIYSSRPCRQTYSIQGSWLDIFANPVPSRGKIANPPPTTAMWGRNFRLLSVLLVHGSRSAPVKSADHPRPLASPSIAQRTRQAGMAYSTNAVVEFFVSKTVTPLNTSAEPESAPMQRQTPREARFGHRFHYDRFRLA